MVPVFEDVLLFCPEVKTGGPEAMHQLAHQIVRHGGNAHMVYYAPFSRAELDGDILRCHAEASPMLDHFAQYRPRVLREARLGPDTMVIMPEPLSKLASVRDARYQRGLWWLSLDNAIPQNPGLLDAEYRQEFFSDGGLTHFYQSDYTRTFLQSGAAGCYHALSDYTDLAFIHHSQIASANRPASERANRICFFPNKGADLAVRFIEGRDTLRQPVEFMPIKDLTKTQVRDTLFGARIYIDFGHHPGKDRVPREAAIAGAVVLLHAAGAARHYLDHPLPAAYRFTDADLVSGALHRKIDTILDQIDTHFAAQRLYRDTILHEYERFDLEVRSFFFTGV